MTSTLQSLSNDIATLGSRARASLVQVFGRPRFPSTGVSWSGDGTIVTSAHGLEKEEGIEIVTEQDDRDHASVVGIDHGTDIAVLATKLSIPSPDWTDTSRLRAGQLAVVAAPLRTGLASVDSVGEAWVAPSGGRLERYLELSAARFRGLSGSLVLDPAGEALGIATSGVARRRVVAVPTETLRRVVSKLLEHGTAKRGYLGVTTMPVRLPDSVETQRVGLLVLSVEADSPASAAGLYLGDVLLEIEGRRLTSAKELLAYLSEEASGRTASLRTLRAGEVRELSVRLGERS